MSKTWNFLNGSFTFSIHTHTRTLMRACVYTHTPGYIIFTVWLLISDNDTHKFKCNSIKYNTITYYYLGSTWSSVSDPLSYMRSVVWSRWTAYHISKALCFYLCITFPYTIFFARGLSLHLSSWHSILCLKLIWNTVLCTVFLDHRIQRLSPFSCNSCDISCIFSHDV